MGLQWQVRSGITPEFPFSETIGGKGKQAQWNCKEKLEQRVKGRKFSPLNFET